MKINVGKEEARFKVSDAKAYDEEKLVEAFARVNFKKVEVQEKPANLAGPAKKDNPAEK